MGDRITYTSTCTCCCVKLCIGVRYKLDCLILLYYYNIVESITRMLSIIPTVKNK